VLSRRTSPGTAPILGSVRESLKRPTRRLPLRGADLVLMAMRRLWPRHRLSNNTLMIVECEGPIAPARVQQAFDGLLDFCAWPAARLRRPFPWGKLHWAVGRRATLVPPPVRRVSTASAAELHVLLEAELNGTIDPWRDPPLRVLIVDAGPESAGTEAPVRGCLVFTWCHPLMDPRGGQNLLAHLADFDRHDGKAPWRGAPPSFLADPEPRPLRERARMARRSVDYMRSLMSVSPVSPGTGLASPGPVRFRRERFIERESPTGAPPVRRDICWRLAIVGKAMAEVWQKRGLPDVPFLVPISVDLRRKGDPEPTFGNALAFHFARFKPSDTHDVIALSRVLRQQMAEAVREGQIEANAVAMEFLQYRPLSIMLRDLPGTSSGETFSFNCADLGDVPPAVRSVFGSAVETVYHVPAVLPRPGIGVFFNRCGTDSNLVISWIEGAVSDDEVTRIMAVVREGMGWNHDERR
jgi:hypothetical protein